MPKFDSGQLKLWLVKLGFLINYKFLLFLQVLLQSEKVPANFSDRSLLKNLGHWLGLLTLARNRPILMRVSTSVNSEVVR